MDDDEKQVLEELASAWCHFLTLPGLHADDVGEFRTAIRSARAIIAWRVAERVDPYVWRLGGPSPVADIEADAPRLDSRVEKLEGLAYDNLWGITGYDPN